jgi:hypothetical protein
MALARVQSLGASSGSAARASRCLEAHGMEAAHGRAGALRASRRFTAGTSASSRL